MTETDGDSNTSPAPGVPGQPEADTIRVKLPNSRKGEQFAIAELMLGSFHIRVRSSDGVSRLGRIKGKMKRRVWIREGDIIIIVPWSFQDEKCDIIYRYTPPQRDWLRRNKYV
ncbi:translation initiation factor eIF-1A [uncultured Methanospirillum sp.]|uniref:translation initiation factor eIF-1A n=1 Tax=uncultured Methanospirillum sp. TaxID=262503 RepID=UPI0029C8F8C6|nr:translation initiation factor eIF-1A [uncultured Methanospirillum sp.]